MSGLAPPWLRDEEIPDPPTPTEDDVKKMWRIQEELMFGPSPERLAAAQRTRNLFAEWLADGFVHWLDDVGPFYTYTPTPKEGSMEYENQEKASVRMPELRSARIPAGAAPAEQPKWMGRATSASFPLPVRIEALGYELAAGQLTSGTIIVRIGCQVITLEQWREWVRKGDGAGYGGNVRIALEKALDFVEAAFVVHDDERGEPEPAADGEAPEPLVAASAYVPPERRG